MLNQNYCRYQTCHNPGHFNFLDAKKCEGLYPNISKADIFYKQPKY